jgi:hypothetical protein
MNIPKIAFQTATACSDSVASLWLPAFEAAFDEFDRTQSRSNQDGRASNRTGYAARTAEVGILASDSERG